MTRLTTPSLTWNYETKNLWRLHDLLSKGINWFKVFSLLISFVASEAILNLGIIKGSFFSILSTRALNSSIYWITLAIDVLAFGAPVKDADASPPLDYPTYYSSLWQISLTMGLSISFWIASLIITFLLSILSIVLSFD